MSRYSHKLAQIFQCSYALNKKAISLKHSWDEVAAILDKACARKRGSCGSCRKR